MRATRVNPAAAVVQRLKGKAVFELCASDLAHALRVTLRTPAVTSQLERLGLKGKTVKPQDLLRHSDVFTPSGAMTEGCSSRVSQELERMGLPKETSVFEFLTHPEINRPPLLDILGIRPQSAEAMA